MATDACDCLPFHVDSGKTYYIQLAAFGNDDSVGDMATGDNVLFTFEYHGAPSYDYFAGPMTLPSTGSNVLVITAGASLEGSDLAIWSWPVYPSEYDVSYSAVEFLRDHGCTTTPLSAGVGRYYRSGVILHWGGSEWGSNGFAGRATASPATAGA